MLLEFRAKGFMLGFDDRLVELQILLFNENYSLNLKAMVTFKLF